MSITAEEKARLIKEFAIKEGDTGSPEVQVAILTSRIATLTEHFKSHKKRVRNGPCAEKCSDQNITNKTEYSAQHCKAANGNDSSQEHHRSDL